MASVVSTLRHRVDPAPLTALVALGDLVCIAAFVVAGATFGHGYDPMAQTGRIASTYATFVIGWVVTSFLAGLYAVDARRSLKAAVGRTVAAWLGAAVIAQGLRALQAFPGNAALTFFLVSVAVGLALLVPWRIAVTLVGERS